MEICRNSEVRQDEIHADGKVPGLGGNREAVVSGRRFGRSSPCEGKLRVEEWRREG